MKTLFLTIVAALFLNTAFAFHSDREPEPGPLAPSNEIGKILNAGIVEGLFEKDETAAVLFVINDLHQVVVLNVQSANPDIQNYIKNRLNYKEIQAMELRIGQQYLVIVNFKVNAYAEYQND